MSQAKQRHTRQYFDDYMEIIKRKGFPGNVKRKLCQQVNEAVVATTQQVIEQALEAELSAYLGTERYEHLPWGREAEQTRSGCYRRELITQYGCIADLRVPKLRKGNAALEWQTISRYQRYWALSRPAGDELLSWAESAGSARVNIRDPWRGVVRGLVQSHRRVGGTAC